MGYFDALTSGYFKTAPDGRKLFFPWGILGRGYTIDSDPDYERLRRQVKAYTIVSLVLIVGVTALQAYVGAVVIGALLIAFYLGWLRYLLVWRFRSPHHFLGKSGMRTSEPKPH